MSLSRRQFALIAGAASLWPRTAARAAATPLALPTAAQAVRMVRAGTTTATALVEASLARIAIFQPKLNAFITVSADRARRDAAALDRAFAAGTPRGPLHGAVLAVKDNIDTGGERTTGGSPVYQMRVPAEDAPAVARLRAAGAIIIGKTNLNELAMSDGRQSFYGRVRNPWALDRQTGGSSSGSCAAVAAGLVHAAIGTDTGGSIRNPSAWCGTVGLKPTSGLVPNRGTLPLSPSLDTIGPVTRSVEDAALLLGVMAGYDRLDITSEPHAAEDYVAALSRPAAGLRVARLLGHFDRLEPEVAAATEAAIAVIARLTGSAPGEAALPDGGKAMRLMPFGETYAWYRGDLQAHPYQFSATDRATLESLAGETAADYLDSRWEMERLRRTVNQAFADWDVMVFPTVHTVAPRLVLHEPADPDGARAQSALFDAGLLNVLGLPGLSIPCGLSPGGLPIGLCLVGPRYGESNILALAHAFEQATTWHGLRPPLTAPTRVPPIPES